MRRAALLLAIALVTALPPAFAQESDGSGGFERVVDITFPLSGGEWSYVDTYFAPRSGGRIHRATDIMADKMVHIHAARGGEICTITGVDSGMPSYGYMMTICGDDGLTYNYVHLNNDTPGTDDGAGGPEWAYAPGLAKGDTVERGQWIGWVGDSGNAEGTAPHLHFEIEDEAMTDQEGRINPYPSLVDAEERGDVPRVPDEGPAPAPTPGSDDEDDEEPADSDGGDAPTTGETGGNGAPPQDPAAIVRLAGATRIETAIAMSRATRTAARTVVVVPAGSPLEALVAAPLAGLLDAPVLLSAPDALGSAVRSEVNRLGALNAYVVGSTTQLGAGVEDDLRNAGVRGMARLAAADPYTLSAEVAYEIASYGATYTSTGEDAGFDEVFLALGGGVEEGRTWPDALSASALAAAGRAPILLVEPDELPQPVREALASLAPIDVSVVGGTAAISDAVAEAAADAAGGDLRRLAGADRYATSAAVAQAAHAAGLDADAVWVATGRNFPDALAAGPGAATDGAPLLLVDGEDPQGGPGSREWLGQRGAAEIVVVGGENAVAEAVAESLAALAAGGSSS